MKGRFPVEPGSLVAERSERWSRRGCRHGSGRVGFDEYHVNDRLSYPDNVQSLAPKEFLAGKPIEIRARVADDGLPDEVKLWVRPAGMRGFGAAMPMQRVAGQRLCRRIGAGRSRAGIV